MPVKYSVAEARAQLPRLLDDVEASGSAVQLTRRGKPVAMLVSMAAYERFTSERTSFGDAYRTHRMKFAGVSEEVFTNLRDPSHGRDVSL